MPQKSRGSIIKNQDVAAATFVVGSDLEVADFTDIQTALDNLPPEGGKIQLLQGSYALVVGLVLPDAPVEIIGSGSRESGGFSSITSAVGTTINLGANLITAFNKSSKKQYRIANLTVRGTGVAGQGFFDSSVGDSDNFVDVENVHVDRIQNGFTQSGVSGLFVRLMKLDYSPSLSVAAQFWTGGGGLIKATQCSCVGGTIDGSPEIVATDFHMDCTLVSGPFVNLISGMVVSSSFLAGEFKTNGSRATQIVGNSFQYGIFGVAPVRYLDLPAPGGFPATVIGNDFVLPATSEEIRNAGDFVSIVGNTGLAQPIVTETGAANNNRYEGISAASTILGADSVVNGSRKKGVTAGATTGAFVNQFTHTNPKGVMGVGTIKNTGGVNALEARVESTDAFGVTATQTLTVAAGGSLLIEAQVNVSTARPSYVSFGLSVRHPVAATTFNLQFTSQGAA